MESKNKRIGVIVGRFQVPYLTRGHKWLIETALSNFDRVLILVGDTKTLVSGWKRMDSNDPFPFEFRKKMILKEYPGVLIQKFEDVGNVMLWNQKLDNYLESLDMGEYFMVGSRNSFLENYNGKYTKCPLDSPERDISGTNLRNQVYEEAESLGFSPSADFMKGIIWAVKEMERLNRLGL